MKNVLKVIIGSKFFLFFLRGVAALFLYDKSIFSSKYFKNGSVDGAVWLMKSLWFQRVLGFNRLSPYPMTHNCVVSSFKNLEVHPDSINNLQSPGCYFQNFSAKIKIDKDVYIGPNVGIITANHNLKNPEEHLDAYPVTIEEGVWIGMNSVIMPGVHLKKGTVVASNSVVTKSIDLGDVLIAGAPSIIKKYL